ncbi:MAG: glycosyltransferase family 39 protein [bacterium]|nr:glycosyltransferase family 39 protein [bacterium]
MSSKLPPILAIALIGLMLTLAIISLRQESAIMDEVAHIPAGYSYLTQRDMRLNPEHPPLLKDLSAIPLLFMRDIKFPSELKSWKDEINSQWDFGFNFLYNSGNNADKIIFWARIPMLLLLILTGFILYKWTKELYGKWPALMAIFLFSFAPTFIAHGRYVTTDVGAAFGFFISIYFFVKYVQNQTTKNLIFSGIFFGVAQLIKFSLFLLIPYFGLMIFIWVYAKAKEQGSGFWKLLINRGVKLIIIFVIGYLLVYPVYLFHVSGYPAEKQISDTEFASSHFPFKPAQKAIVWMVERPVFRSYAQYFLGLAMVFQRATGGNTTFFLGEVTNKGWKSYFPIAYAIKPPLALHILTIIALLFVAWQCKKPLFRGLYDRTVKSFKDRFPEWAMLFFLAVFWASSLTSNLNIGVRHILPTFPFVYILISGQFKKIFDYIKDKKFLRTTGYLLVAFLLAWYAFSSLSVFPYYLTHFNELVGGAKNGYKYITDSNLDWGQDLKRLKVWIDKYNVCIESGSPETCIGKRTDLRQVPKEARKPIEKIKVDYFGGATVEYYFGSMREEYRAQWGYEGAKGSWLAVSATFKQQGQAVAVKGWNQPTDEYMWLTAFEPVTVVGNSIFVYYIK